MKYELSHKKKLSKNPRVVFRALTLDRLKCSQSVFKVLERKYRTNGPVYLRSFHILNRKGEHLLARRSYKRLEQSFEKEPVVYFSGSAYEMRAGNYFLARRKIRLCLRYDRGYYRSTCYFWLAVCNVKLGNISGANVALKCVPKKYTEMWLKEYRRDSYAKLSKEIQSYVQA